MQPKTIKSKNNNMFEMEDNINFFFKKENNLKKIMQPKTIKSKTMVVAPLWVT